MKSRSTVSLVLAPIVAASVAACSISADPTPTPSPSPSPTTSPGPADPAAPADPATPDPTPAKAPTAKLDATFAGIADATNEIQSMALGPSGVTYVAFRKAGGSIGWGNGTIVRRYTSTGKLDATFGTAGETSTILVANPQALAVDSKGRVLVGGSGLYAPEQTSDTGREIVAVRMTAAGAVDTTWGSGGRAVLSFSPANVWSTSARARDDGGLFLSVYGRTNGKDTYGSFLLSPTGAPVTTYGTNGFVGASYPTDGAVAVGNDVLVPTTEGLVRYGADGKSAGTFVSSGVAMIKASKGGFTAIVAGSSTLYLARFDASGKRDAAFKAPTVAEDVTDFAVRADGSVLVADPKGISWVSPSGGALVSILPGVSADKLAVTSDDRLMVLGAGDSPKVSRYVF